VNHRLLTRPAIAILGARSSLAGRGVSLRCSTTEERSFGVGKRRQKAPGYTADEIIVPPIPPLEITAGRCRRTYRYRFSVAVPGPEELERLARRLSHSFRVQARALGDGVFIEIPIHVAFTHRSQCEVDVSIGSTHPEEDPVFLYGLYTLPRELERVIGRVESIEGHPRQGWLA
jgi:hypothetical protein